MYIIIKMLSQKDIYKIRSFFPIFKNKQFVYFDNAATTQKPYSFISSINEYYSTINANVHRGEHYLSQRATEAMEECRNTIRNFINADSIQEIILTKGTTESINLLCYAIDHIFKEDDEIIISQLEHHSNIVPWQLLCHRKKTNLKVIPLNKSGYLDLEYFNSILSSRTRLVSICHISNVFGLILPIKEIIIKSHEFGALVCIDGAQAISHIRVNVKELDVDFYTFSAHKIFGPTGVGVLYGKKNILNKLSPWQGGGGMIKKVNIYKTVYEELPYKFEGGTPNISGIVSFQSAIELINQIGIDQIFYYENNLMEYLINKLSHIHNLIFYYKYVNRSSIISFNIDNVHSFDVGSILSKFGIFIRTGHHCAQPIINYLGILGTIRISCCVYNTYEDVDNLYNGLIKVINFVLK